MENSANAAPATPTARQPQVVEEEQSHLTPGPSPQSEGSKTPTPQQEFFEALCLVVGWDWRTLTAEQRAQVGQTAAALTKAGYAVGEVRRFHDEVWARDWRWQKKRSYPTLGQVRAEIAKVRQQSPGQMGGNDAADRIELTPEQLEIKRWRAARRANAVGADGAAAGGDSGGVPEMRGDGVGDARPVAAGPEVRTGATVRMPATGNFGATHVAAAHD